MADYLAVTDTLELTARGREVVAKHFLRRGEVAPAGGESLPDYVSGERAHMWLAPVYNPGAPSVSLIRGGIANCLHSDGDYEIVVIGDSKTEGYNTGGVGNRPRWSWPGILRHMLGGVEGTIIAMSTSTDDRWTGNMVQGTTRQPGLRTGEADADETFTFSTPHTGGSFLIYCAAGGTVQVRVDSGAPQSFTIPAGGGFHPVTPTVTGDGTHTYQVTSTASIVIHSFRPAYSGPRLKISNLARSGVTAAAWMAGDQPDGTGHWDGMLAATTPDAVISQLGTNSPAGPPLTALWAQIAALNVPALIITPGGLDLAANSGYAEQYTAQYAAADTHDLPLIDFAAVIGTGPDATARGLMAGDRHENRTGFVYETAAVFNLIGVPVPLP